MKERIEEIRKHIVESLGSVKTSKELFEIKSRYVLGKSGDSRAYERTRQG